MATRGINSLGLFAATVAGSRDTSEKFARLRLHRGIHLDERRPGAFEAFARKFFRRVNDEFAAAGDLACGVVELRVERGERLPRFTGRSGFW